MKKFLFSCLFVFLISNAFGAHITGGEIFYQYIGPGALPNTDRYRITLRLFRVCGATAGFDNPATISTFRTSDNSLYSNFSVPLDHFETIQIDPANYPCITNVPTVCFEVAYYYLDADLPVESLGYSIAYTRCCRVNNLVNITPNTNVGNLFTATIPGASILGPLGKNASPVFVLKDTAIVCGGNSFVLDFGANDPDIGDSLSYSFCAAFNGPGVGAPAPPPNQWFPLGYTAPYSGTQPLGSTVTINPVTGLISGVAPNYTGSTTTGDRYVVSVCVTEWRNGQPINVHRKDFILRITDCIPIQATPNFASVTCNGFTVNFNQSSTGGPNQFYWDFGDPASGPANTSTLQNPSHTFTDTGVFQIKLRVSINGQCTDSVIRPIGVYPLFFPGFTNSTQLCVNTPIQFTDTTYFRYGNVTAWRWNFGDPPSGALNTSTIANPSHTYNAANIYSVKLVVTNDKGCIDSITKNITISDNPLIASVTADTSYCGLDSLQLNASGPGSFNWTPNTNIIGANTATPRVFPPVATWYFATLTNAFGCSSRDSVRVTPKFDLSNSFTASSISICEEDTIILKGTTNKVNNITWQWSPGGSVQSPANDTTLAYPTITTNYVLTTRWGSNCVATASRNITVKPLAVPNAGPDAALCNGQQSIQLNASGGNTYVWSPAAGLSNPNIANPVASPSVTTTYTVTVGVNGCSKTRSDSMVLTVRTLPAISTTNDTLICYIDTLQINSTGTGNFVWTPNYMISNTNIANPLVSPDVPTMYYVRLTDAAGCYRDDSVFVDVRTGITLNAGNDTVICMTDSIRFNPISDGLYYQWTPSTYLNFDNIKNPMAAPLTTTTYTVVSSIGKCSSTDDITITPIPYPVANAGPDRYICSGFSAQLNASGGTSYAWSPATFLSNTLIANPQSIKPTANIMYIVNVRENFGCPKPVKDTVWVFVEKPVIADAGPRDTTVVLGQPLQLNATGGDRYTWYSPTWLNNPTIQNPIALPEGDITYTVTATTNGGCIGQDFINVKLFKVDPDLYVPTAFSPDGNGRNDLLRPILLGMKKLHYFRVYNRWGKLVYSTTQQYAGWDGKVKGKGQSAGTYIWMAEGVNYRGELRQKKGYTILIR